MNKHNRKDYATLLFMILYLDSSALFKLYAEPDHVKVKAAAKRHQVAICSIGFAEVCSALARREREGSVTSAKYQQALSVLQQDWQGFLRVAVDIPLNQAAEPLIRNHRLRGMDGLHLAAALSVERHFGTTEFLTFDQRLLAAASREMTLYVV